MSDVLIFNMVRRLKRRWTKEGLAALTQAEVDEVNAVLNEWKAAFALSGQPQAPPAAKPAPKPPTTLRNAAAFWERLRGSLAPSFNQSQVEGFEFLLGKMGKAGWPIAWTAYGLATAWHETAQRMQPVREGLDVSDAYRRKHFRYYPHYGRGYPQTTWEENYKKADDKLGLGGTLVANPDRMLEPDIAADTMIRGMEEGWFAGDKHGRHTLARHLPSSGRSNAVQRQEARRIINGTDRAVMVAGYADKIEMALESGLWG